MPSEVYMAYLTCDPQIHRGVKSTMASMASHRLLLSIKPRPSTLELAIRSHYWKINSGKMCSIKVLIFGEMKTCR